MRLNIKLIVSASALLVFGSLGGGASAAVLTFGISPISNFDPVDQGYGDNITATTIGNFSYGAAEGMTPNITVAYGNTSPAVWTTGYGTLTDVLFENADSVGVLTITMTAEAGYEVVLHGFDLAGFDSDFVSSPTIALVDVSSASGSEFSLPNAVISETAFTNFDFSPTLQASELTIMIDARNLGNLNDSIAIDNITFSQVAVPEPSSSILIGLGTLGLFLNRQRKS